MMNSVIDFNISWRWKIKFHLFLVNAENVPDIVQPGLVDFLEAFPIFWIFHPMIKQ
jgi:hypothetical protein